MRMTREQTAVPPLLSFDAARYLHDDSAIAPRYGVQHLSPALATGVLQFTR